ncbi:hypothetical protein [Cognatishimia activa]|uniref:hypothetical protein n=1 Tax=Cognatishimia activa TaxID=1715691 RepID=UPI00222F4DDA|nr:hypothetical protein [Cognatishimia activa]UZD90309.1 hypothetical protein M0D42_12030 [Cognatishimia activa]
MKSKILSVAALALLTVPTFMNAQEAGRDVIQTTFESADTSKDGKIDVAELTQMAGSIFFGMDYDQDNTVSEEEFFGSDFGLERLATERDEADIFGAAKRILFALRDRNQDGFINQTELERSTQDFMRHADLDGDETLSTKEYEQGYVPSLVFRAALAPRA